LISILYFFQLISDKCLWIIVCMNNKQKNRVKKKFNHINRNYKTKAFKEIEKDR